LTESVAPKRSQLERALDSERLAVGAGLSTIVVMAWLWIVPMALDMYGPMTGESRWMMAADWPWTRLLLLFAMWIVMMVAMMVPSAAPTVLLYVVVGRRSPDKSRAIRRGYLFVLGYLSVWTAFAALATALQRMLSRALVLSPMMELQSAWLASAVLAAAGLYQLTPLKTACLASCRAPAEFLASAWQPGDVGAWRMGVSHGWVCFGCCWALMLLLFVGGVMNLAVIGLLTIVVLVEKLAPFGRSSRFVIAGACIVAATAVAAGLV
jgi:predicted metal-binding membrane protein